MKKILVVIGHPSKESFCGALAWEYTKGAKISGNEIETLCLKNLFLNGVNY